MPAIIGGITRARDVLNQRPIEGQEETLASEAERHLLQWLLTLLGIIGAFCLVTAIAGAVWVGSMVFAWP
jgi:hypothetical protein